jgi:ribosomal protein S12 methylthiotransferase accessory factor
MVTLAKRYRAGTHRSVSPDETLSRIRPLFDAMGITRAANVTGLDNLGIPVFITCRPNSRSLSVSQGKGVTADAARVSSIMESIEFFHAENIVSPLIFASRNQLRFTHRLVTIEDLPKSSISCFHDDLKIPWIKGVDLLAHAEVFLPFELIHLDFTLPLMSGSGCFAMSSNGLASGNHLFEAIVHGVSEVIERDADTLFELAAEKERRSRQVDPGTVDDPECAMLLSQLHDRGIYVAVWDITSTVGVPAFRCYLFDRNDNRPWPLPPSKGMGCHPDKGVALSRALTEAAQCRLTWIASSRDDLDRFDYRQCGVIEDFHEFKQSLLSSKPSRSFSSAPSWESDDIEQDIHFLTTKLSEAGIESLVVVDLTLDVFGIPVVRVVIPGLEGANETPGWSPGARALKTVQEKTP